MVNAASHALHAPVMPENGTPCALRMAQSDEGSTMDKNRTEGMKHEVKGAMKEAAGKLTGNHAKQAAGNIEKNAGKVQKEVGKAADQMRDRDRHH
jgi:uncharacterized protein YjbJ (UPF0337 family)